MGSSNPKTIQNEIVDPHACNLWGRTGCGSLSELDGSLHPLAMALVRAMKLIKSARFAATISGDMEAARAAITGLQQIAKQIDQAKNKASAHLTKLDRKASTILLGWLRQHLAGAMSWLPSSSSKSSRAQNTVSADAVIHLATAIDGAYYAILEHFLTCSWAAPAVQPPHVYFPELAAAHSGNAQAVEDLLTCRAPTSGLDLLLETWDLELYDSAEPMSDNINVAARLPTRFKSSSVEDEDSIASTRPVELRIGDGKALRLGASDACANPLLAVMWARFQEAARLFSQAGLQHNAALAVADDESSDGNRWAAAPCSASMTAWRSASREVHLYAFAAPNRLAIEALSRRAPLVEIGAGTGYWAWVLKKAGIDVLAFDIMPPGQTATALNTYHGRIPCFTEVAPGGVKQGGRYRQHTLLLCYPPPGQSMAADCLNQYRGSCVCVIGEWDGDTGSASFTRALQKEWRLLERVVLPNWTDSGHELTIWDRLPNGRVSSIGGTSGNVAACAAATSYPSSGPPAEAQIRCDRMQTLPIAACAACGATQSLRRCRYCRSVQYCSSECRKAHGSAHAESHAMRFLNLRRRLSFRSEDDFECLKL